MTDLLQIRLDSAFELVDGVGGEGNLTSKEVPEVGVEFSMLFIGSSALSAHRAERRGGHLLTLFRSSTVVSNILLALSLSLSPTLFTPSLTTLSSLSTSSTSTVLHPLPSVSTAALSASLIFSHSPPWFSLL